MMSYTDANFDADEPAETFNPFPGLRPFETDEYTLFFGREGQSDELLARLGRTRFLAVVGTSGSGKSSLIRAGLLPALYGGLMAGAGSAWRVALLRPGGDPIGNLAAALCSKEALGAEVAEAVAGEEEAEASAVVGRDAEVNIRDAVEERCEAEAAEVRAAIVEATLRRSTLGLVDVVRQARLKPYENLLVVVDQFEELFRFRSSMEAQGSEDDAAAFVKLLLEAPQQKAREELAARRKQSPDYEPPPGQEVVPVYVVLTMRSDFLGDCSQFQGLPEAINDGQYLIPRMTRDERRAAITGPAAVGGVEISLPLVNRLLNDVGDNPDQLPILQHALMRTWDQWSARCANGEGGGAARSSVELSDYEAVGGMADALSRHADEAFNALPDERSRLVAEKMFKALTEKGADNRETRRPATLGELCEIAEATPEEVSAVVETFRQEGRSFLMPPVGTPLTAETVIDISHESLIRNWERLKAWVDEEAQSARTYRRLAEAATLHGAGLESLASGAGLQVALDWRDKARPNSAWARHYHPAFAEAMTFLDKSKEAHEAALAETERQREEQLARERRELEQAQALAEQQALSLKQAKALAEQQAHSLEQAQRFAEEQKKFAEEQQKSAEEQRKSAEQAAHAARRARRLTFVMVLLALVAVGTAAFALKARADANKSLRQAVESQREATIARQQAEESSKNLYVALVKQQEAQEESERERKVAEESEKKAVAEQKKAEAEKNRANEQARIAAEREQEAVTATAEARAAAAAAAEAAKVAEAAKDEAIRRGDASGYYRDASVLAQRGEVQEAGERFLLAAEELEKLGDVEGVADTEVERGNISLDTLYTVDVAYRSTSGTKVVTELEGVDRPLAYYDSAAQKYVGLPAADPLERADNLTKAADALFSVSESLMAIAREGLAGHAAKRTQGALPDLRLVRSVAEVGNAFYTKQLPDGAKPEDQKLTLKRHALERYKKAFDYYRQAAQLGAPQDEESKVFWGMLKSAYRISDFYFRNELPEGADTTAAHDLPGCETEATRAPENEGKMICYAREFERLFLSQKGRRDADIGRLLVWIGAAYDELAYRRGERRFGILTGRQAGGRAGKTNPLTDEELQKQAKLYRESSNAYLGRAHAAYRELLKERYANADVRDGEAWNGIADIIEEAGRDDLALFVYGSASRSFDRVEHHSGEARMAYKRGKVYSKQDDESDQVASSFKAAVSEFEKALQNKQYDFSSADLFAIGSFAEEIRDEDLALKAYTVALAAGEAQNDLTTQARAAEKIAFVHSLKSEPVESRKFYARAFSLYSRLRERTWESAAASRENEIVGHMLRIVKIIESLDKEMKEQAAAAGRPAPAQSGCPYFVQLTAPQSAGEDDWVTFSANPSYSGKEAVKYTWTFDPASVEVVNGAGTPHITVDTTGLGRRRLSVALVVEVGTGDPDCRQMVRGVTNVGLPSPVVNRSVRQLRTDGGYGNIRFNDEKARLDNFATELQNDPNVTGYIIAYAGRNNRASEADHRMRTAAAYLTTKRGVSSNRIVTVNGGFREEGIVEFWIVPPGATPPDPTPTSKPEQVRPAPE